MAVNITDGALSWKASIDTSDLKKQIKEIQDSINGVSVSAKKQGQELEDLGRKAAFAIGTYLSVQAAQNFISQIVRVRGEFQQLEVAFTTMLQSKEKADKLLAEVTEFAATTPFGLTEVASVTKQLLAFGIQAEDVKKTLRELGDVAAGIGQPLGEIAYLYGTIKTQGVALTQDVRQFASRGIPIYEELGKVLNVSVKKVGEFITAGKVGFPEIQKVFENLTAEGSKFGGLMDAQSKTLIGLISNLEDAVDRMFNDLGKSSEGVFTEIIQSITFVVENYQKILDVLKVLIITYGSYKAAVIATTVVQRIQTAMLLQQALAGTKLNTVQALSAVLVRNVQGAWKALNATLRLSPIGIVVGLIGGLVAALVVWTDKTTAQERAQKDFNEANKEFGEQIENLKNRTSELVAIIQRESSSRFAQVRAFKELQQLYPGVLDNMDLMSFKALEASKAQRLFNEQIDRQDIGRVTENLKKAQEEVSKYSNMLNNLQFAAGARSGIEERFQQAKASLELYQKQLNELNQAYYEANTPIETQIKNLEEAKKKLIDQRTQVEKNVDEFDRLGVSVVDFRYLIETASLKNINDQIDELIRKIGILNKANQDVPKDKSYFEKIKKDAEDIVAALDINDNKFSKKKAEQIKIIREAEKQIEKYDTSVKKSSSNNKLENERNRLLELRLRTLNEIAEIERSSRQTGLDDYSRDIDQINQKYDQQVETIKKAQDEIEKFNDKNKGLRLATIGKSEFDRVNSARQVELANFQYKKDAENYILSINEKEDAFRQLEQAQLSGNAILAEKAREEYQKQTGDFTSYIEFLQSEYDRLFSELNFDGNDNIGIVQSFEAVTKLLNEAQKKSDDENKKRNYDNLQKLIQDVETFNQRKFDINKRYNDLEKTIVENQGLFSPEELEKRRKAISDARALELKDLERDAVLQSDVYKKIGEDLLLQTKENLQQNIREIRKVLKEGYLVDAEGKRRDLTPEMKKQLKEFLDQLTEYVGNLNEAFGLTAEKWKQIADTATRISGIFRDFGSAVQGVNGDLGDMFNTISQLVDISGNLASAIGNFASGNIIGGIGGVVGAIGSIFSLGSASRESRRKAMDEMQAFQQAIINGELELSAIYRERERQMVKINQTRLEGLEKERDLLLEQQQIISNQYDDILKQLQQQEYIAGQRTEKYGGFLGAGRKTRVVNITQTIGNRSYEELEALYTTGALQGKAKELFEMLKKIKEEGDDINELLLQNQEEAKQIFTGTTADSIVSSIVQGFKEGKRSAADFADDFQDLMREAVIKSLELRYLEGPLTDFFDEFANLTQSGDQLDAGEIERLQNLYNSIIENAATQFQQLQDIANLNFTDSAGGTGNNLAGAVKGITEQQAQLLAGQFGGMRVTLIDQLRVAETQLRTQQMIEVNTAKLHDIYALWRRIETSGLKVV